MSGKHPERPKSHAPGRAQALSEPVASQETNKQPNQKSMNILLIHGVNTVEDAKTYETWEVAIKAGLEKAEFGGPVNAIPMDYNKIFLDNPYNDFLIAEAAVELIASTGWHSLLSTAAVPPPEPPANFTDLLQAGAGMVAQWVLEPQVRSQCSDAIFDLIQSGKPDVIFAHSLGTLLCYDFFTHDPRRFSAFNQGTLVTFGSQINNPFVRNKMWPGQIQMIPVARWINIYNKNDPVFVAPLEVPAVHFYPFKPVFGNPLLDWSAHAATTENGHPGYLDNPVTESQVYPLLAGGSLALRVQRNIDLAKLMPKDIIPTVKSPISPPVSQSLQLATPPVLPVPEVTLSEAAGNFYTDVIMKDPRFNSVSCISDVNLLEPILRAKVARIISAAAAQGVKFMVYETYRSTARQQDLYDQGYSKLKQVGVHHYGLACDIVRDIGGKPSWDGDFSLLGKLARAEQLVWGGDWTGFRDEYHVQRISVSKQKDLFAGTWYPDPSYNPYQTIQSLATLAPASLSDKLEDRSEVVFSVNL